MKDRIKELLSEVVSPQKSVASIQDLQQYLKGIQEWFDVDEISENTIRLSTRENGDVGEEKAGKEDIKLAREILRNVRAKFKNVKASMEIVDEWVVGGCRDSKCHIVSFKE